MSGQRFGGTSIGPAMRALILGHFSTVGDIDSLAYVTGLLREEGVAFDVLPFIDKLSPHIEQAVRRDELNPSAYTHLVVVCGPFWPELLERREFPLERFAHCARIGVNLTMVEPTGDWNPFHLLIERDSDRTTRPDLSFLQESARVPVIGLCVIDGQREYGDRQRHAEAIQLMRDFIASRKLATVEIDTRWPAYRNSGGFGSPDEVASLIERMDVVSTNRLHGLVYALKVGVPALAIDPVEGGGKVTAQAQVLGWPAVSTVDEASTQWLERTFDWCLSDNGRSAARGIAMAARDGLRSVGEQLRQALRKEFPELPVPRSPGAVPAGIVQGLFAKMGVGMKRRN